MNIFYFSLVVEYLRNVNGRCGWLMDGEMMDILFIFYCFSIGEI